MIRASDVERFRTKFHCGDPLKCWEWEGTRGSRGYGQFKWYDSWRSKFRTIGAHRFALYVAMNTVLDKEIFTDHTCMNRNCVNPSHLRAVSILTSNTENANTAPAINKRKTHCIHGHEFTADNTATYRGWRYCRECKRVETLARYHRKRDLEKGAKNE